MTWGKFRRRGSGQQPCQWHEQEGLRENNKTQLTWQESVLGAGVLRVWLRAPSHQPDQADCVWIWYLASMPPPALCHGTHVQLGHGGHTGVDHSSWKQSPRTQPQLQTGNSVSAWAWAGIFPGDGPRQSDHSLPIQELWAVWKECEWRHNSKCRITEAMWAGSLVIQKNIVHSATA